MVSLMQTSVVLLAPMGPEVQDRLQNGQDMLSAEFRPLIGSMKDYAHFHQRFSEHMGLATIGVPEQLVQQFITRSNQESTKAQQVFLLQSMFLLLRKALAESGVAASELSSATKMRMFLDGSLYEPVLKKLVTLLHQGEGVDPLRPAPHPTSTTTHANKNTAKSLAQMTIKLLELSFTEQWARVR